MGLPFLSIGLLRLLTAKFTKFLLAMLFFLSGSFASNPPWTAAVPTTIFYESTRTNNRHLISASSRSLRRHADHPPDTEAVGDHAEARRPERLGKRHLHLAAFGQRAKFPFGVCFVRRR
jgi:hypothetical protein